MSSVSRGLSTDRLRAAVANSSQKTAAAALARGYKLYKEEEAPPKACPPFVPPEAEPPKVGLFSCGKKAGRVSPEAIAAMEAEHASNWQRASDLFQAMIMDNEEEGFTTISQEDFLLLPKTEVGFTDTRRVEVGMGNALQRARETQAMPRDTDSSGRVYPGQWLGKAGLAPKEDRPVNAESYGGKEESVNYDPGLRRGSGGGRGGSVGEADFARQGSVGSEAFEGAGERGSYGQRSRGLAEEQAEGGDMPSPFMKGKGAEGSGGGTGKTPKVKGRSIG
ncbi:hypothetical protein TeGR_g13298 [Tetraparma gracilis]|uniref:Uncharacterized protein n=1 Tax=Tetraparma gracilis TaxID=2962635 RepID=A0ABQ6MYE2_9STRA|nr:hypothetical protein TeGR_g13298 [Tetraparma gracilis]